MKHDRQHYNRYNRGRFTNHIRVFHPVDAVPVSQVCVPLLIVVAGVGGLVGVGGCGGVN